MGLCSISPHILKNKMCELDMKKFIITTRYFKPKFFNFHLSKSQAPYPKDLQCDKIDGTLPEKYAR